MGATIKATLDLIACAFLTRPSLDFAVLMFLFAFAYPVNGHSLSHNQSLKISMCTGLMQDPDPNYLHLFMPTPFVSPQELAEVLIHPISCTWQAGPPSLHIRSGGISVSHSLTKWWSWAVLTKDEGIWDWYWQRQELCAFNDFSAGTLIIYTGMIWCISKVFLWQGCVGINNPAGANPHRAIIFSCSQPSCLTLHFTLWQPLEGD